MVIFSGNHAPVKYHNSACNMLETIDQEDSDNLEWSMRKGQQMLKFNFIIIFQVKIMHQ